MNFLQETTQVMMEHGRTADQIIFIGSEKSGHQCTWDEFKLLADREYDDGYGAPQVADDLVVVFNDGARMLRGEYDGSEWWDYHAPFMAPQNRLPITSLFANRVGWECLAECQGNKGAGCIDKP